MNNELQKSFECICGRQFSSEHSLRTHKQFCEIYLKSIGKALDKYVCSSCRREFKSNASLQVHLSHCDLYKKENSLKKQIIRNKIHIGYYDGNDHICEYGCGKIAHYQLLNSKWCCKKNPGGCSAIIQKQIKSFKNSIKTGKYIPSWTGKHHSDAQKINISEKMKIAHKEGRAHNIGESRWNNEPSYPEKWFMTVISNHFIDKKYIREYPFHRFSLDFAWVHKKKCIEIDGDQHQRFEDYKERDKRKDTKLKEEGWEVLRLRWKDLKYNNTQYLIQKAIDFIGS